jgi:hypothetical protein
MDFVNYNLYQSGPFTNYVDMILAFLTTYPPVLTFSMVATLTKIGLFWTTYLLRLVNIVCEQPHTEKGTIISEREFLFDLNWKFLQGF